MNCAKAAPVFVKGFVFAKPFLVFGFARMENVFVSFQLPVQRFATNEKALKLVCRL